LATSFNLQSHNQATLNCINIGTQIETIGGERSHDCEMGAGRCGNIGQPAK